ncbi:hypothetical protein AGB91_002325 [Salmonella enterica subsp. enterica]|nr:hypothetical protein [Salmonella enterica subsp. enterica]EEO4656360.1 hypothetical protein [Salmonella enterica subsp. enterica]
MTTNNHPAHGPVSLDRLHQIRETLSKAAAQSDGGNLGYAMADAVKVIDGILAIPETLPCSVLLEPGLRFGKGVRTKSMLDALRRRADYQTKLESMTPEQRAEHEAGIAEFRAILPKPVSVILPDEIPDAVYEILNKAMGDKACLIADELWDACRTAVLEGYSK